MTAILYHPQLALCIGALVLVALVALDLSRRDRRSVITVQVPLWTAIIVGTVVLFRLP